VLEIDPEKGRIRLSRKAVLLDDPNYDPATDPMAAFAVEGGGSDDRRPREGGDRGGDRGGRGGDRGGRGGHRGGGRPGGGRGRG
jgi:polyribonucleotide nucleotidyltransferase